VTETTFNLDSPATSNNQYFILVRFHYSSNEYFDIKSSLFVQKKKKKVGLAKLSYLQDPMSDRIFFLSATLQRGNQKL
jgi:hypothetical protein